MCPSLAVIPYSPEIVLSAIPVCEHGPFLISLKSIDFSNDFHCQNNTIFEIVTQADGLSKPQVLIPRTACDSGLNRSLLSRRFADETRGILEQIAPVTIRDSRGHVYHSNARVSLRWWRRNDARSFPETFYIVEGCGSYDAMLQTANGVSGRQPDQALPLRNPRLSEGMLLILPQHCRDTPQDKY